MGILAGNFSSVSLATETGQNLGWNRSKPGLDKSKPGLEQVKTWVRQVKTWVGQVKTWVRDSYAEKANLQNVQYANITLYYFSPHPLTAYGGW